MKIKLIIAVTLTTLGLSTFEPPSAAGATVLISPLVRGDAAVCMARNISGSDITNVIIGFRRQDGNTVNAVTTTCFDREVCAHTAFSAAGFGNFNCEYSHATATPADLMGSICVFEQGKGKNPNTLGPVKFCLELF